MRARYGLPLMFFIFGFLLDAVGFGNLALLKIYRDYGREATGQILSKDTVYGSNHVPFNALNYAFTLPDGRRFTGHQTGYSGNPGEPILIQYLDGHPRWNKIAGAGAGTEKKLALIGFAGLFFTFIGFQVGWTVFRQGLKKRKLSFMGAMAQGQVTKTNPLEYAFTVFGKAHKGRVVMAEGLVRKSGLKVGDEIKVLYDSQNPNVNIWSEYPA